MSTLISLENISLAYGLETLLDSIKLQIASGERICLIGRNGAGKSSLLKIIEGSQLPDSGHIWRKPHLRLARLAQDLPQQSKGTVFQFVAEGLSETGALLAKYHEVTHRLTEHHKETDLAELQRLQQDIDAREGWHFDQRIQTVLTRLSLNPDQRVEDLSGGWQRRVALAQALVSTPELLLLDEPTNHLDIEAIQWLEEQLLAPTMTLLFITHDRAFLERVATRIIELDRGQLTSWPGDYSNFLRRKEEMLHAETKQNAEFDKKLAEEERWIRQGIKARRTRNEGRVRALEAMRSQRLKRRELQGKASFVLSEAEKSGHLVVEAKQIAKFYQDQAIIRDFSLRIMRGDRIGLIGPNGIGKTTLLNLLLGKISPDKGIVEQGTKLEVAYFDQLRQTLDLEKTVFDNVAEGSDVINVGGKKRHIISYLNDFLFTPKRALTPVKALSGGECNRLLLARLFSKSFNVLVLDEPTNDLDIETLELLEELLVQYQGTLLLVSHDRIFLDNVVTSTLIFEGDGKITEYIGGYRDWINKRSAIEKKSVTRIEKTQSSKKLSYKEQKELSELPQSIEKMERELAELQQRLSEPAFYQKDPQEVSDTLKKLSDYEALLAKAYTRWQELEAKQ